MTLRRTATCTLAAIFASACGRIGDASSSFSGGSQPETAAAASSGSSSGTPDTSGPSTGTSSTGDSGTSDDSAASMPAMSTGTFDVGVPPDFDLPPPGCQGKIDFLFVIESWYSMKDDQDRLQAAFSSFTTMIGQEFAEFDYHIMVVDTADSPLMPNTCDDCYMCIGCTMPGCGDFGGPLDYPCDYVPSACDITPGAGVVVTGNFNASNQPCELFGGNRYIIKDEPALAETFKCIASLGEGPKTPWPMYEMMAALEPSMLDVGGCNEGFLRDDALLAVIVLAGTADNSSPGTPQSWYDTLVTAKNGNEEAVVVLTVSNDLDLPDPTCEGPKILSNELRLFAETAKYGRYERLCIDSYVPALEATAETILQQCSVFVPQ
ncbi:MAG: hypothetical protein JNL82_29620 [Myxococcales bacterium]|nr:hypothetical protein [Myxococcales bacterium]